MEPFRFVSINWKTLKGLYFKGIIVIWYTFCNANIELYHFSKQLNSLNFFQITILTYLANHFFSYCSIYSFSMSFCIHPLTNVSKYHMETSRRLLYCISFFLSDICTFRTGQGGHQSNLTLNQNRNVWNIFLPSVM